MSKSKILYFSSFLAALIISLSSVALAEMKQAEFEKMFKTYIGTDKGQEAVGSAVETYFKGLKDKRRKEQEVRQEAQLEEQFKNPVKVSVGSSPVKGPKNAKVTIIEFSDFQCPYCKRAADTMAQVLKEYPNDVKVSFKNLPLGFHKHAMGAAKAALAAGKQGKYWEMHDALFENQKDLGPDYFTKAAKNLKLDMDKFKKDMDSEEIAKQIAEDQKLAAKHEIRGTPGYFVNGVQVKGAYPFDHFKMIIDRWLKKG
ncbi:thioredoxin domain-containing protein [Oligoflexia bacterium]|nr:thioredoxin domain-containing protein [Oligoflexia bacterium]